MARESGKLEVHSFHNEILYGYNYRNFATSSMQECLQHCISDCLCQSFQIYQVETHVNFVQLRKDRHLTPCVKRLAVTGSNSKVEMTHM